MDRRKGAEALPITAPVVRGGGRCPLCRSHPARCSRRRTGNLPSGVDSKLAINTKTAASIGTGLPPRLVPMADPEHRADFNAEEREHEKGVEPNHLLTYDPQCVEPARLKIRA